jgi:multisubunit Na+/H+ antiporter MnhB subunit
MKKYRFIFWELLLVFASVLIFRSLWMIFDKLSWMNESSGILGSLLLGIILTFFSLIALNEMISVKKDQTKDSLG